MTNIVRFSPNHELSRMQNEFDRIFNDFFPIRSRSKHYVRTQDDQLSDWSPRVDLSETDDGYTFSFDLPGLSKKDIDINYKDGILTVSGERLVEEKKEEENFLRVERRSGKFSRSFNIPNAIQTDKISANYKNGVLRVELLKAEEVKPVKVQVS